MARMFDGLSKGYQGSLVPVLSTEMSLFDTVRKLDHLQGSVLPTSSRKISHCKVRLVTVGFVLVPLVLHVCARHNPGSAASSLCHPAGLSCFLGLMQHAQGGVWACTLLILRKRLGATPVSLVLRAVFLMQALFDRYIDANSLVTGMEKEEASVLKSKRVTPKMFAHSIKQKCIANPQRIVLPEVGSQSMCVHAGYISAGHRCCDSARWVAQAHG
jgi:hypothetical protein